MANRPIPIDPELTAVAVKAPVPDMIADQVLPEFPVTGETFKWNEFPVEQSITLPDTKVGRKGRTNEVEFGAVEKDGSTEDHGLQDTVPITDKTANTAIDPEAMAAEMVSQMVTLAREARVAGVVFNPNNYVPAQVTAYAAGAGWYDPDSDPLEDFEAAIDTMIVKPNTLTLGRDGFRALRRHPKLIKAARSVNSTGEGRLSIDELRELLDIPTILVGQAHLNLAKPGQPAQIGRVWSGHASLTYVERIIKNGKSYSVGATARLGGKIAMTTFDPNCGLQGGNTIRVGERIREYVQAKQAGWLFQNAGAAPA